MEFFKVLKKRRSVRAFRAKEIEREKIEALLNAVNSAPSAGNLQAYKIFVVKNNETKKKLARAAFGQTFIAEAPVVFVFSAVPGESSWKYGERGLLYSIQDATIAASYSQLAATALGLASVWIGAFNEEEVKKALEIKKDIKPIALIPLGYTEKKPERTPRKKLDETIEEIK